MERTKNLQFHKLGLKEILGRFDDGFLDELGRSQIFLAIKRLFLDKKKGIVERWREERGLPPKRLSKIRKVNKLKRKRKEKCFLTT